MKKTKINRLYDLYVDNPAIKDQEAAELLDTDTSKSRITAKYLSSYRIKIKQKKESADFGSKLF